MKFVEELQRQKDLNHGLNAAWPGMKKTIDLTKSMKEDMFRHQESSMNLAHVISTMHKAVGGELWVEGTLIWKNGVQVGEIRK